MMLPMRKVINAFLYLFNKKLVFKADITPADSQIEGQMHKIIVMCQQAGFDFQQSYELIEKTLVRQGFVLNGWQRLFWKVWSETSEKETTN